MKSFDLVRMKPIFWGRLLLMFHWLHPPSPRPFCALVSGGRKASKRAVFTILGIAWTKSKKSLFTVSGISTSWTIGKKSPEEGLGISCTTGQESNGQPSYVNLNG